MSRRKGSEKTVSGLRFQEDFKDIKSTVKSRCEKTCLVMRKSLEIVVQCKRIMQICLLNCLMSF